MPFSAKVCRRKSCWRRWQSPPPASGILKKKSSYAGYTIRNQHKDARELIEQCRMNTRVERQLGSWFGSAGCRKHQRDNLDARDF